jgi:phenylacetate-coenzyme A ligase PaaK-like adenylate-forming protein
VRTNRFLAEKLYWAQLSVRGRGVVRERLDWLIHNETISSTELDEIQAAKLRELVAHSYRTVPYYRRVMQERGLTPDDIRGTTDLTKLPVLTRAVLNANHQALRSSEADLDTLQTNYSSGSTGQRAEFDQDLDFRLWMRAHQLRTYRWCGGWRIGEPFVLLWGSEIYWSFKQRIERWENRLTNRREFNTFHLDGELIDKVLDEVTAWKPALVSSYANAFHLLTNRARDRGLRIQGLRAVQATSEPLPPELRARIENTFGCEVFDKYGSRETNVVSHESPDHRSMLVQAENVVVEVLDDTDQPLPPGQPGRVVLTPLNSKSMPLLRYETSDIASHEVREPAAAMPFPRMSSVAGRLQDLIVIPGGGHLDSYFFSYLIMQCPDIHWFQVTQSKPESLSIRVYAPAGLSRAVVHDLVEHIRHHSGFKFDVDIDTLTEMPTSSTGKFRLCVSALADAESPRSV